jgi:hypothetical protein
LDATFAQMAALRKVIADDPVLCARVDTMVGAEFSLFPYRLSTLLLEYVFEPLVTAAGAYRFDPGVFAVCDRLEAALRAERIRFIEYPPVLGSTSSVPQIPLPGGFGSFGGQ